METIKIKEKRANYLWVLFISEKTCSSEIIV
jgi:hypothetical protein